MEDETSPALSRSGSARFRQRASESGERRRLVTGLLVPLSLGVAGALISIALGVSLARPGGVLALVTLWAFLLAGFIYFALTVPIGSLFAFRGSDVVWGVGVAVVLRLLEGLLLGAAFAPFPAVSSPSVAAWIGEVVLPAGLIGPLVEELYFRAFLAVIVFRMLAPRTGQVIAGFAATCVSAGAFVLLHACFAPLPLLDALILLAVGAACAALVLLTGRICGAILLHATYNFLFIVLAALGTVLA